MIVNRIKAQRTIISIKASKGDFKPKKKADQRMLRMNCAANISKAVLTWGLAKPCFHTRNKAMPIRMNKAVHTGANTQFGGLKEGFSILAYQLPGPVIVKKEPIKPAKRQIRIESASKTRLFIKKEMVRGYKNVSEMMK